MVNENENFNTSDLALAAALVESGHKIERLERSNPRRISFIFENSIALSAVVNEYWYDQLSVNPRSYFDTLKHLKARIYSE
jgi:hypothetical protein